jgi:16S rRNA (cytidine1402-2'-O)-methyltransferase
MLMSSGKNFPSSGKRPFQGLQVTATPIGNLGDLSPRAQQALENADLIACEDTRHTGLLLSRLGIEAKLVPYHDHSGVAVVEKLIKAMKDGKTVTLVSDAGTPLISDPGYKLVTACQKAGINITSIPGPSAMLAALAASGLPTDRFYFSGFLPSSAKKRMDILTDLNTVKGTLIFYETPLRIMATLEAMMTLYPERNAVLARELTKLHESFYRGRIHQLYHQMKDIPLKGEMVLMLAPIDNIEKITDQDLADMISRALDDGLSRRDAVAMVADKTKMSKKHIYGIALGIKDPDSPQRTRPI